MTPLRSFRIIAATPLRTALAVLAVVSGALVSPPAGAQTRDTTLWATNADVETIVRSGSTIYLGGRFTEVGPVTGAGVAVQYPGGAVVSGFPKVTGLVYAVAPDGEGGWYIGGLFTAVNGIARSNAAHIRSDLVVSGWNPNVGVGSASRVNCIVVHGSRVYLGGFFSSAGGQTRNNIATVDRNTGLATGWNPEANTEVYSVASAGGTVLAAGRFSSIGGQTRNNIAQLDTTSGLATVWNPNANLEVLGVVVHGSTVYAWGDFSQIGGQVRPRLAALDVATGLATAWNPRPNDGVRALVARKGVVYIGGQFTNFFVNAPRNSIAALDSVSGLAHPWNPNAGGTLVVGGPRVRALVWNGAELLVGGNFATIGGQARSYVAALDTATALSTAWDPHAGGEVLTLATTGATVFAGGGFVSMNGVTRNRIAALDATSGAATAWNPNANATVRGLAVRDNEVYAVGDFSMIGGMARTYIAKLDRATGLATAWNPLPQAVGAVFATDVLAMSSGVFFAGDFDYTSLGGAPRTDLAALDRMTAQAFPWWDPRPVDGPNNAVHALATSGSRLYIGGAFRYVGGLYRNNIAALDTLTSQADFTWNPDANNDVFAIAATGNTVYAGGIFTSIGGQPRNRLAELDPLTAQATAWNPDIVGSVRDLGSGTGFVCAVGPFNSVGGEPSTGAVALDPATGQSLGWAPQPTFGTSFLTVDVSGSDVYLGGTFLALDGRPVGNIAAYRFAANTVDAPTWSASGAPTVRAWPNPFVQGVAVGFTLTVAQEVRLDVLDVTGRRVWSSPRQRLGAGPQVLSWDGIVSGDLGARLGAGVYFLRVAGADFSTTRRVVRL